VELREQREAAGVTVAEMAAILKVTQAAVRALEGRPLAHVKVGTVVRYNDGLDELIAEHRERSRAGAATLRVMADELEKAAAI